MDKNQTQLLNWMGNNQMSVKCLLPSQISAFTHQILYAKRLPPNASIPSIPWLRLKCLSFAGFASID